MKTGQKKTRKTTTGSVLVNLVDKRLLAAAAFALVGSGTPQAAYAAIGNPGHEPDGTGGDGAVDCEYRLSGETDGRRERQDLKLWYDAPATDWSREALPIGNGHLGAMIFGGVERERIQFNEDSLWTGDEKDTGRYQAFGDLSFQFKGMGEVTDYRRELDLERAVVTVAYTRGGTAYRRECFASYPAQTIIVRFTADRPGAYTGGLTLVDRHGAKVIVEDGGRTSASGAIKGGIGLRYESQVRVLHEGGTVQAGSDGVIWFKNCDSIIVLLAAGTDYVNRRDAGWKGDPPGQRLQALLASASEKPFEALLAEHVADYQSLFNRVSLDLGETEESVRGMTTERRLIAYRGVGFDETTGGNKYNGHKTPEGEGGHDPGLESLLFQYARYLMLSSSRPGSLPANLQGVWNQSNNPPWRSDYHTDVNVQMNYWFTGPANLTECAEPLAEWLHSIIPVRREATRKAYGTRGWATRSENGIFGGASYHWVPGDAAWVAQNIWDHYAFSLDRDYLETRAYPIIRELCEFWEDFLKEDADGKLVSPPSISPEHGPQAEGNSYEQQLVYDLFTNYIEASRILDVDPEFRKKVEQMRSRLAGPRIGRWGQLQEWAEDRDDPKDQHRHLSHMIAVHPGRQISPLTKPTLAEAAKVSMDARGDASTGWSRAWKISIWARLLDGDRAYRILNGMLRSQITQNLLATHPPFQIDANFGYAAGVCEMLLQSHLGFIHLLPALPSAWATGSARGLLARGGFVVDIVWADGALREAEIISRKGGVCRIRSEALVRVTLDGRSVSIREAGESLYAFDTQAGESYRLKAGNGREMRTRGTDPSP